MKRLQLGWTLLDCVLFLCLWMAAPWLLGGCGDAGSGTDPCGNCKPPLQCASMVLTVSDPSCGPWKTCGVVHHKCVDPSTAIKGGPTSGEQQ